jgi:hypothetical protein
LELLWSLELGIWSFRQMNFLAPWFLLGGLAIGGPILFHLIRRAARERVSFSSLMFLRPTAPRLTRRRRLENFWLLLLRCLALLLLATGFARPFFSKDIASPTSPGEARQIVLLVDTSASMRREGLWTKAQSVANSYLDKASPADQFAVMTFDRQPRTLVSFAEWTSWAIDQRAGLARQRLAAANPGWMSTQLGLALTSAAEQMMNDSATAKPAARREVILISDMQEGAKLDGLQGHDWPTGVKVSVERIEPSRKGNAGVEILAAPNAKTTTEDAVRVRIANARDSNREKFQMAWTAENGGGSQPMEIYLPPGQARSFTAPKLPAGKTSATIRLSGDDESFDNTSYYAAPEFESASIAWFGKESVNDPDKLRYYIERIFPAAPHQPVQVMRPYTNSAFSPEMLNHAGFGVIAEKLAPEEVAPVRDWLSSGKSALLILTDSQMAPTLAALTGLPEIQMTEATNDFALIGDVDFSHPLFAPFADPRFSDFTHIHFWKHRRWEIPAGATAHVLAKFDDGSPALTQLTVGKGNLLVLASGWNPADSQFALSSKFPPLIQRMLDWSGADAPVRFQFLTGDAIPGSAGVSPASSANARAGETPAVPGVEWQKPDGKKITLSANAAFTDTDIPGIYTASVGGKQRRYAVNLSLDESRTTALAPDELARLGVPLQVGPEISVAQLQVQQRHLQQAELENRQKLWRWLIAGVLAITLVEIMLGGWLVRRVKTVEVTA